MTSRTMGRWLESMKQRWASTRKHSVSNRSNSSTATWMSSSILNQSLIQSAKAGRSISLSVFKIFSLKPLTRVTQLLLGHSLSRLNSRTNIRCSSSKTSSLNQRTKNSLRHLVRTCRLSKNTKQELKQLRNGSRVHLRNTSRSS